MNDPRPTFDARAMIHWALTFVLGALGILLILPFDTFGSSPAWRYFSLLGSENTWGLVFGAFCMIGLLGADTHRHWLKQLSVLMLAGMHGSMAALFLLGNPIGGGSISYLALALQGFYLALRQVRIGKLW